MKKFAAVFQVFEYVRLAFAAKVFYQATLLRNEPYQAFRLMCVQSVTDKCP